MKELTPWLVVDGHCAMRCIKGTDINDVANRVAFIEKTPRVRVAPYTIYDEEQNAKWLQGQKGRGGCDGNIPENELYGFYPPSREWCDKELLKMGYVLTLKF